MRNKLPTLASVWKQFVMEKTNNFNSSQVIELQIIDIIHFNEDLFAEFTNPNKYLNKLLRVLKSYI